MTSRALIVVLFYFLNCSFSFGYLLTVPTSSRTTEPGLTAQNVSEMLAFNILKLSLDKNNISYSFGDYGLGTTFTINGLTLGTGFSGTSTSYSNTVFCVLWPRTSLSDSGVCECDYTIFGTFYFYYEDDPNRPGYNAYYYYVYFDSGVVTVANYLGSFYDIPWAQKSVVLNTSLTCSMPFDYDANSLINYFVRPTRILNLTQSGSNTSVNQFRFGSIAELFSYQFRYAFLQAAGNPRDTIANDLHYFDLRTKQNIYQASLPWQLQLYNVYFNQAGQTKPTEQFSADTDLGSEPDISEYYTGHNYLNVPSDDWGQPADIGGGSSGVGGEITGFSQGAQGQMTSSAQQAITSALGDPTNTSLDIVPPSQTPDQITSKNDIDLDSSFMSSVQQNVSGALPDGVTSFQSIINALKSPDTRHLPVVTLPFTFDLRGFHNGGYFDSNRKPQITFDWLLNDPYRSYYVNGRALVVIFMTVCLVIYIIQDVLFLGGRGSEN